MTSMKSKLLLFCLAICCMTPALYGADWSINTVHVTQIEPSYLPAQVLFTIDQSPVTSSPTNACPAGSWLTFQPYYFSDTASNQVNVMGIYTTLMAALKSGKPIDVYSLGLG